MTAFIGAESETLRLMTNNDVVTARRRVRDRAVALGLDLVAQTKIVTAASELARNTVIYGGGGELEIDIVQDGARLLPKRGLRLSFVDEGPGIADLERAMTGGWSSGTGLGLGLPGSQRLVHEFDITSAPGQGTRITAVIWRRDP